MHHSLQLANCTNLNRRIFSIAEFSDQSSIHGKIISKLVGKRRKALCFFICSAAAISSAPIEADIRDKALFRINCDAINFEFSVTPADCPGINDSALLVHQHLIFISACPVEFSLQFLIILQLREVFHLPVNSIPTISPGSPAPAACAVCRIDITRLLVQTLEMSGMAADGPYFLPLFIVIQRIVHEIKKVLPADEVIFDDDYFPILFHDLGNTADHGSGKALMFRCLCDMYRSKLAVFGKLLNQSSDLCSLF